MKEIGRYDTELQMFVEEPKPLNTKTLILWRKLAESGKFGRKPEGPPAGEIALGVVIKTGLPVEAALRQRIIDTGDY